VFQTPATVNLSGFSTVNREWRCLCLREVRWIWGGRLALLRSKGKVTKVLGTFGRKEKTVEAE
jgi:hypothetical protein